MSYVRSTDYRNGVTSYCGFEVTLTDPLEWQPFVWRMLRSAIEESRFGMNETACCYWAGASAVMTFNRTVRAAMAR